MQSIRLELQAARGCSQRGHGGISDINHMCLTITYSNELEESET